MDNIKHSYDYCSKQFVKYTDWLTHLLRDETSEEVKFRVRFEIIKTLRDVQNLKLNEFCEKHNYCPVCGEGGWDCHYHAHKRK